MHTVCQNFKANLNTTRLEQGLAEAYVEDIQAEDIQRSEFTILMSRGKNLFLTVLDLGYRGARLKLEAGTVFCWVGEDIE